MTSPTVQCVYCHAKVEDCIEDPIPSTGDDSRWAELAEEHESDCEWITTRAHRVFGRSADRSPDDADERLVADRPEYAGVPCDHGR